MSLKSKIESLLLVSNSPLTVKKLSELTKQEPQKIKEAAEELFKEYQEKKDCGIVFLRDGQKLQLATNLQFLKNKWLIYAKSKHFKSARTELFSSIGPIKAKKFSKK